MISSGITLYLSFAAPRGISCYYIKKYPGMLVELLTFQNTVLFPSPAQQFPFVVFLLHVYIDAGFAWELSSHHMHARRSRGYPDCSELLLLKTLSPISTHVQVASNTAPEARNSKPHRAGM